ncbi:MAG TPA: DUF4233 domain-containing protein [Actinocrinis sp.]
MAMSVLVFEAFIALFFGLAVGKLHPSDSGGWIAAVVLGCACVVLAGMTRMRWSITAGWVLQLGFLAAGFVIADMFVLGAIFTALWWAGLHYGAKAEQIKAQRVAAYEERERSEPAKRAPSVPAQSKPAPQRDGRENAVNPL